jgi:AcrR family transcriptional regulator
MSSSRPAARTPAALAIRRLAPDERRRELLEQALLLFATRPYDEVTVAELAERAGASEGLVFRYFEDKRNLYLEAIRLGLERAVEASNVVDLELSPTERFEAGLGGFVDLVERFPFAIPQTLQGGPAADPELQAQVVAMFDTLVTRIVGRMGVEDPPDRLRWAVRVWLAFVQVSTAQWINAPELPREKLLHTQIVVFRAAAAEALGVEARPTPPGGPPPLLP